MKKIAVFSLIAVLLIGFSSLSYGALQADDLMVYDSNSGYWYGLSVAGGEEETLVWAQQWGWPGADTVSGDYNGDGTSDMAVYDQVSGSWYVLSTSGETLIWGTQWGWAGAETVPGDYNGDGKSDMAVYDQPSGSWYILSPDGEIITWGTQWGWDGAETVPGDYDGDGKDDLAVYDQNSGYWYIYSLSTGEAIVWAQQWGWPGAETVPGDYDGDGKDDLAVYDQNSGYWYVLSADGEIIIWAKQWGWPGAKTVSGDFNGDDASDLAIYDDASGSWYVLSVADGVDDILTWATQWGWSGAIPVKGNYGGSVDASFVYDSKVKKIEDSDSVTLTSTSSDGGSTFSVSGSSSFNIGDIMLSTSGTGYLCKVTSVTKAKAGTSEIIATSATLEEAFEELLVNHAQRLTTSDVKIAKSLKKGVSAAKSSKAGGQLVIQMNSVVLYDKDGDEVNTTSDQIVANGSITIDPEFEFSAKVRSFKLEYLKSALLLNETAEITIGSEVEIASYKKEIDIISYTFTPITAGPVVLVPIITVHVGVDGSVTASLEAGVTQTATAKAGLIYRNNKWSTISGFSNDFEFTTPSFALDCSVKAYAGPQLDLLVYGVAGPYIEVNGYLLFQAEILPYQSWDLYGGVEAKAGIKLAALSYTIAEYDATVFDWNKLLDSSGSSDAVTTSGDYALTSSKYDDDSDWDQAVQNELGSGYRVADWTDLEDYHSSGGDLMSLYDGLGMTEFEDSAYVTRNGDPSYSSTRYYFASRHEGGLPTTYSYLAHENIGGYILSLGSWNGSNEILAIKKTATQSSGGVATASEGTFFD